MVEYTAHNGKNIGSTPIKPNFNLIKYIIINKDKRGFEPLMYCYMLVFKTSTFDHSVIYPY